MPHSSGHRPKKIRGRLFYFGTRGDPVATEAKPVRARQALVEARRAEDSIGRSRSANAGC